MTAEVQQIVTRGSQSDGVVIERSVDAWCYGPLAVHISWEGDGWCVTHITSGLRVCAVGPFEYDAAHEIAAVLAEFDWTLGDANRIPGPLRVAVTEYLREARKKYPELESTAIDLEPARL